MYMKVSAVTSTVYTSLLRSSMPDIDRYIENGSLEIKSAVHLYGLKQSAKEWYDHLTAFFTTIGYRKSIQDPCLFCKHDRDNSMYSYVLVHVDDLLLISTPGFHIVDDHLAS